MDLRPVSEVNGIKFFDNAPACISHFEKIHWTKKAISLIQSSGALFVYALNKTSRALYRAGTQVDSFPNTSIKDLSKKRLVVCIHGLNSKPTQFKRIVDEMHEKGLSETDIFIPPVLQKGNAKLDEMVKPIFEEIEKWAKTPGKKELVLVGISNGGRIARAIEVKIAQSKGSANIKKLRFVSIVGACKGSSLVNLIHRLGLPWLMSENILEEMPTTSKRSQQLNEDWMNGLSRGPTREYTFIASPHDWLVTNYDSTLMEVGDKIARYAIVPNHGHVTIVNAVAKPVAEIILS